MINDHSYEGFKIEKVRSYEIPGCLDQASGIIGYLASGIE